MRDIDPTASEWITSGYLANSRPGGLLYDLGSVVAAVAPTVIGGLFGDSSTSSASDSQAASTAASIAEQRRQYDQTREDYAPYRDAGKQALGQYQTEINGNTTAADALAEPGYQFGLQQGQLGLDRKAAAAGGRVSGAALKAASEYATNYATTGYNAAYQRRQDRLNRLAALANIGQTATTSNAGAGSNASNAISGLISAQGNATGASQIARGNIWGGVANQLGAVGQKWATTQPSTADFNSNLVGGSGGLTQSDIYSAFA